MSGSDPDPPARPDLRLLPLVAGLWPAQAATLLAGPSRPWLAAALGGLGMLLVLSVAWRAHLRRRPSRTGLVLFAAGAALGALVAGLHLTRLHPDLIQRVVEQSAVVAAVVRVTGDPVAHRVPDDGGRPTPPSWRVTGTMVRLTARGTQHALSVPVLLRGDAIRDVEFGALLAVHGRAAPARSPQAHGLVLRVHGDVQQRAPPGAVARATTSVRTSLRAACAGLPADAGALLLGLAVGDESTVPAALDAAMIRSGLAHLTAVSGTNTSLVLGVALGMAALLGVGWRTRALLGLAVLAGYVALVRPQPSVLRAAAMGVVALLALSTGGRRRGPPALLAACVVLLVGIPSFATAIGFGLSVAATGGLLVVGPPIAGRLARWAPTRWVPEPMRAALAVAAAAHLATLPLVVLMGNGVSAVAIPANVLAAPMVPVATVLGLAAAVVAPFADGPAVLLARVAAPATGAIARIAHAAAGVPGGVVAVDPGPAGALGVVVALGLAALLVTGRWRPWHDRRQTAALVAALLAVLVVRHARDSRWPPPGWLVLACDVGQGDALLLRAPGAAEALLVDTGPDPGPVASCLADAGVHRLSVVLTHFHADHVDGLASVLDGWPVDRILVSAVLQPEEGAARVARLAGLAGVPVQTVRAGQSHVVAGLTLAVLWPASMPAQSPANNGSVVGVVQLPTRPGPLAVLLTGDIEPEAQVDVMAGLSPGADVVKVPHHGSDHQVPGFAAWAGARIALVTVGRGNGYGHPSESTLVGYRRAGALVGRTDHDGALAVVLVDGRPALVRSG